MEYLDMPINIVECDEIELKDKEPELYDPDISLQDLLIARQICHFFGGASAATVRSSKSDI